MVILFARALRLTGLAVFLLLGPAAWAQDAEPYIETFDGSDTAIMLNGVIDYGAKGAWSVKAEDGKLQLYNADNGNALRYYTVPTLSYPGSNGITRTDGATVKVSVRVSGEGRSGAGIIAGFEPQRKDYLLFAVGPENQVYVVQRKRGKAMILAAQTSDAVLKDSFNTLEVRSSPEGLEFYVNGAQVIEVGRDEMPGRGVGIGAFGRGSYDFDTVTIEPPIHPVRAPKDTRSFVTPSQRPSLASVCSLPKPSPEAQIVVVGAYEGEAISTLALAGTDQETTAARIRVEPGQTPLYVLASATGSMLWAFEGDTQRIERIVLSSGRYARNGAPGVGVTGLDGANVSFAEPRCLPQFHDAQRGPGIKEFVERLLERQPDAIVGSYSATTISLPSGEMDEIENTEVDAPDGFDEAIWDTGLLFAPAGLMRVPIDDVVSASRAKPYDVFPNQFGLAQLVAQGKLQVMGPRQFRIVQPFPFYPAGLTGSHSVTFVLPEDIPEPSGSPGHSRVIREAQGEPLE